MYGRVAKVHLVFCVFNVMHPQNGSTPLTFAAENGHKDVVKLLVESGANIDRQNKVRSS